MKAAKLLFSAAASSALAGTATAQLPVAGGLLPGGLPAGSPLTAPPPPNALGIAPQPAPPGGQTIWQMLGVSQQQREFRRRQLCMTPAGGLLARIQAPISTLSGGLIRPFCPATPSLTELLDPGAIGAAAKVKQDRAGAEQRIKAVKYLGTVDCHYWPEAEEALIGALRNDRNECVRYEAAVVLANGCCCTPKIIAALGHAVSCSDSDGAPSEKSPRVRAAAAVALERCLTLSCGAGCGPDCATPVGQEMPVTETKQEGEKEKSKDSEKEKEKEKDKPMTRANSAAPGSAKAGPPRDSREPLTMKEYYASVNRLPRATVHAFGRKALEYGAQLGYATGPDVNPIDYVAAGLPVNATPHSISNPNNLSDVLASRSVPSMAQPNIVPASSLSVVPQNVTPVSMTQPITPAVTMAPMPATAPAAAPVNMPLTLAGPSRPAPGPMQMDLSSPITATAPTIPERTLSVIPASRPTQSKPPVTVMPWPSDEPKKLEIVPIPGKPADVRPATPSVAPTPVVPSTPNTTSMAPVIPSIPTIPTMPTTPATPSSVASTISVVPSTPATPSTPVVASTPKTLSVTPSVPVVPAVPVVTTTTSNVKPAKLSAPVVLEKLPAPEVIEAPVDRILPASASAPIVDSTPAAIPTPIPGPVPLSPTGMVPTSRPAASQSILPGPVPVMPGGALPTRSTTVSPTALPGPVPMLPGGVSPIRSTSPNALPGPVPMMPGGVLPTRSMADSPNALPGPVPVNPVTSIPATNLPPVESLRPQAMIPPTPVSIPQVAPTVTASLRAPVVTESEPVIAPAAPAPVIETPKVVSLPPVPAVGETPKVVSLPVPTIEIPKVVAVSAPVIETPKVVAVSAPAATELPRVATPAPAVTSPTIVTRAQESTPLPPNAFDTQTPAKPTPRKGYQDPKPVTLPQVTGQTGGVYYPTQWSPNPANK